MPRIRDYLYRDVEKNGQIRHRFRWNRDAKRITVKGEPGEPEFERNYRRLVDQHRRGKHQRPSQTEFNGTYRGLVKLYCGHMDHMMDIGSMAQATRKQRVNLLTRTLTTWGDGDIRTIRPEHLQIIVEDFRATPGQANNLRKALLSMFKFAKTRNLVSENPATQVEKIN